MWTRRPTTALEKNPVLVDEDGLKLLQEAGADPADFFTIDNDLA